MHSHERLLVKQATMQSERGLSTIQHCLEWYMLVLGDYDYDYDYSSVVVGRPLDDKIPCRLLWIYWYACAGVLAVTETDARSVTLVTAIDISNASLNFASNSKLNPYYNCNKTCNAARKWAGTTCTMVVNH